MEESLNVWVRKERECQEIRLRNSSPPLFTPVVKVGLYRLEEVNLHAVFTSVTSLTRF